MIKNELKAVAEFHDAFGIESANAPVVSLTEQTVLLRHNLMKEEKVVNPPQNPIVAKSTSEDWFSALFLKK